LSFLRMVLIPISTTIAATRSHIVPAGDIECTPAHGGACLDFRGTRDKPAPLGFTIPPTLLVAADEVIE
jgi:hypothetical protein